ACNTTGCPRAGRMNPRVGVWSSLRRRSMVRVRRTRAIDMGFENDLLQRSAVAWNLTLAALLEQRGLSPQMTGWLQSLLPAVELIMLVLVLSALAAAVDRLWCARVRADLPWVVLGAVQVAGGLWALRLVYWVYKHPSAELGAIPARWDYLVSAILGGIALRRLPLALRVWVFALLSVVFLDAYVGRRPVALVLAGCLLG